MVMGQKQSRAAGLDEINNHAFHLVDKYRNICMDKQEFACLKAIALINSGRLLKELQVLLNRNWVISKGLKIFHLMASICYYLAILNYELGNKLQSVIPFKLFQIRET